MNIPITQLSVEPNHYITKDKGIITTVASISEYSDAKGISTTNYGISDIGGAPMLNHNGKNELFKRCYNRLRKHAQKINTNAIVCFRYSISITESGTDNNEEYVCPLFACTMVASGEAVEEELLK